MSKGYKVQEILTIDKLRPAFSSFLKSCNRIRISKIPDDIDIQYYNECPHDSDELEIYYGEALCVDCDPEDPIWVQHYLFDDGDKAHLFAEFVPQVYNLTYWREFDVYIVCVDHLGVPWEHDDGVMKRYREYYTDRMGLYENKDE